MSTKRKQFHVATKFEAKLRMALTGPSGAGKTLTSLILGTRLVKEYGGRLALIDTERGSASKYADLFDFDVLELESFHPNEYVEAILSAQQADYRVLIIDSLSHAWTGKDGALELVDRAAAAERSNNSFAAWRNVTPLHQRLMDTIMGAKLHIVATMRSKMGYIQTQDDRGKTVIQKIGMQPVQRDGIDYEFDLVGDMDLEHRLIISKSRYPTMMGQIYHFPTEDIAVELIEWLKGEKPAEPAPLKETTKSENGDIKEALSNLNKLRETLGVKPEELKAMSIELFDKVSASTLAMDEIKKLREWMSIRAAKAAVDPEIMKLKEAVQAAGWDYSDWEANYLGMNIQEWLDEGHTIEEASMFIPTKEGT